MPLFTIATITQNNAQGIEKTWISIKNQHFNDFEWLVQDGASTDETLKILEKTPAITTSEPDNGIYDAMNRLIARTTGDYIIFLNAGDTLARPNTLKRIAAVTKAKSPDFLYGDSFEQHEGQNLLKPARNHTKITLGMFTHHQSMVYNRENIANLRYNETYTIAADYDFTARFLKTAKTIEYIQKPLCIFEPGGISQQQTRQGRLEQFQIRKDLKLCSPLQNHIITALQSCNTLFRALAPNLYWSLKRLRRPAE